jgi:hypothetical protein
MAHLYSTNPGTAGIYNTVKQTDAVYFVDPELAGG